MQELTTYKSWCAIKGYKPSNAKALMEYTNEIRIQKERFIRSKMSLIGDNLETLAEYLGIARQTLTRKINGESEFTLTELTLLKNRFNLTDEEFIKLCTKEILDDEYSGSSKAIK